MDINNIISKSQDNLTKEEQEDFFKHFDTEMKVLKDKNPERYLQMLKELNKLFNHLNTILKD